MRPNMMAHATINDPLRIGIFLNIGTFESVLYYSTLWIGTRCLHQGTHVKPEMIVAILLKDRKSKAYSTHDTSAPISVVWLMNGHILKIVAILDRDPEGFMSLFESAEIAIPVITFGLAFKIWFVNDWN